MHCITRPQLAALQSTSENIVIPAVNLASCGPRDRVNDVRSVSRSQWRKALPETDPGFAPPIKIMIEEILSFDHRTAAIFRGCNKNTMQVMRARQG